MPIYPIDSHLHLAHLDIFGKKRARPLHALYLNITLRKFASGMIGIFTPLYILDITGSFYWIMLWVAVYSLTIALFSFPLGVLVSRIGLRRSVFISVVLYALYLISLIYAKTHLYYLILSSVLIGIQVPLYWIPFYTIFAEDGKRSELAKEFSLVGVINRLAQSLGPVIGGFMIAVFGFSVLFSSAVGLVLLAGLPLLFMRHHPHKGEPNFGGVVNGLFRRENLRVNLAFWGFRSEEMVAALVWPVFLFGVLSGSYESLGAVTSAVLVLSVFTLLLGGRIIDKVGKRRSLRAGAIANGLVWIPKAFVSTFSQVFVVDSLYRLSRIFYAVPADSLVCVKAKHTNTWEFLIRREIVNHFGGFVTASVFALMWFSGLPLQAMFVVGVLGSWVTVLMAKG